MKNESAHIKKSKREALKELTETLRPLIDSGEFANVNQALLHHYRNGQQTEFRSYGRWAKDGYQVRKGEQAFLLWAKPKEIFVQKEDDQSQQKKTFFPVCYVFSDQQIDMKIKHQPEPQPESEVQKAEELKQLRNKSAEKTNEIER